jgi:hypothetical protein
MPPRNNPKSVEVYFLPEAIEQALKRVFWLEALCMALGAAAETRRTNVDLPHMVSSLADLGAQLAGEASTLLMKADD